VSEARQAFALRWYTPMPHDVMHAPHIIGIVGLLNEDGEGPYFKVYIGCTAPTHDEERDVRQIVETGSHIADEVLARHLMAEHAEGRRYVRV
jgi:hypothetical protein